MRVCFFITKALQCCRRRNVNGNAYDVTFQRCDVVGNFRKLRTVVFVVLFGLYCVLMESRIPLKSVLGGRENCCTFHFHCLMNRLNKTESAGF